MSEQTHPAEAAGIQWGDKGAEYFPGPTPEMVQYEEFAAAQGFSKPSEAAGIRWGDKGAEYRPDRCQHEPEDGCEWCCQRCNTDTHWCPGCGTVTDHGESVCGDCKQDHV